MAPISQRTPDQWRDLWALRPGVTYLNHGSFGPPPREVLEQRIAFTRQLAEQPMEFFVRRLPTLLRGVRDALARFVGCAPDDLVLVDNATTAMNIVARSVRLSAGDEVLLNDHEYGAVRRIWQRACDESGARLVVQSIPLSVQQPKQWADAVLEGLTPRTRLLVFSHVSSPTAVVFPAAEICRRVRQRSVAVCIDGPHALAMRPLSIESLDCDYYTASTHKWLSAPLGSGFLYVHPRNQAGVRPVVVSWGRTPQGEPASWRDEFHWTGTHDPGAYLAIPAAIEFLERAPIEHFRQQTHALAQYARRRLAELTGLEPPVPDDPAWYGSMALARLPPGDAEALQQRLAVEYRIEVPIIDWNGQRFVRVSCHLYNSEDDIERLVAALRRLLT
jgi:isopenicillin-N epimerase